MKIEITRYHKFSRPAVVGLARQGKLFDVRFIADDFDDGNGFALMFTVKTNGGSAEGILYKRDGKPRIFFTPLALMENAKVLGIDQYSIDATAWRAEAYSPYKAQTKWRKQQGGQDD